MVYKIELSKKAAKYLARLPRNITGRILDELEVLKTDPDHAPGTKILDGRLTGLRRMRIGQYRAIYQTNEDESIVVVLIIGPRATYIRISRPYLYTASWQRESVWIIKPCSPDTRVIVWKPC